MKAQTREFIKKQALEIALGTFLSGFEAVKHDSEMVFDLLEREDLEALEEDFSIEIWKSFEVNDTDYVVQQIANLRDEIEQAMLRAVAEEIEEGRQTFYYVKTITTRDGEMKYTSTNVGSMEAFDTEYVELEIKRDIKESNNVSGDYRIYELDSLEIINKETYDILRRYL